MSSPPCQHRPIQVPSQRERLQCWIKKTLKVTVVLMVVPIVSLITHIISSVAAEETLPAGPEACRARIVHELLKERDEERAAIFGARKDRKGTIIVLTTGGKTAKEKVGILETKERLTSELVEPIVQSYRTLRCRMDNICKAAAYSTQTKRSGSVDVQVLGCSKQTLPIYDECRFTASLDQNLLPGAFCQSVVDDTMQAERGILATAVAYDAGYRSMLQSTGIMDWMMEGFQATALRPVRDMVNMLGKLHTIPCFIGQCDDPKAQIPTEE